VARAPARARRILLGAGRIGIDDLVAVAAGAARPALAPAARRRLARARRIVLRHEKAGAPVYGLTTGLGAAVDTTLPRADRAAFQARAVRARAVAVGPAATDEEARAVLFARVAGLAQGRSGISPFLVDVLLGWFRRRRLPGFALTGTLGQGDLAPLAGLFRPLVDGPGAVRLGVKDGLALVSSNAVGVGLGALRLDAAFAGLDALTAAAALGYEAFGANLSILDPRLHALRPAPGQAAEAARLRRLLAGSALARRKKPLRVQDPLSIRSVAPIHGAARAALAQAAALVELELNAGADSPAVLIETGAMRSTVNFDTTALTLAFEAAAQGLAHVAAAAHFRVQKLMSPAFNDVRRFLARDGTRNGFATAQKTTAALEAEIRDAARPAALLVAPVADGVEDYATLLPRAAAKLGAIAENLRRLAAVEAVVAAEAVDQQGRGRLGRGTALVRRFVRARVSRLDDDRAMGGEFEALAAALPGLVAMLRARRLLPEPRA
jgi:histidine ammonia-lyase